MVSKKASRKPKPSKLEVRMKDFEHVNLPRESAALASNVDVEVDRAARATSGKRAHVDRVRRYDAFEALRGGLTPGGYDAARRLERDIVTAAGEHDRGRPMARVDGPRDRDRTDDMVDASARVAFVLDRVGGPLADLLSELIAPTVRTRLTGGYWRNVVALVMHEPNPHAQSALVRAACASLVPAYEAWDAEQRRRGGGGRPDPSSGIAA